MRVLIIPEDFRNDQYILKPLFEAIMAHCGRPVAKVQVCNPPLLAGVTEALKSDRIAEVISMYPFVDLFVLCVDRDGHVGRRTRLDQLEDEFGGKVRFLAENAWEEIETWALAGLPLPQEWKWKEIRADISVKENYFRPLAQQMGVEDGPGQGRKALGALAAKGLPAILAKCPEDLGELRNRMAAVV